MISTIQDNKPTKEQLHELLVTCYRNYPVAAKVFFPERFTRAFDKIHHEIFDAISGPEQKIAIAAPRGIGKTSINNLLLPAMGMLYLDYHYIVPISATTTSAITQSENLKTKLTSSPVIQEMFGNIKTNNFSKDQWVANIGGDKVCVMPRGAGQQVRGILFEDYRPDLIIVDDLEKSEEVRTEEQRAKVKEWFYADLANCIDRGSKHWKMIFIGTVLHEDSLLMELAENTGWKFVSLEICDDDFNSNAPNFMSSADIKELYEELKSVGQADVFYREYRNIPVAKENQPFKQEMFRYYIESELIMNPDKDVETFLILDPARTSRSTSADSACVAVGFNSRTGDIYIRDIIAGKYAPDEFLELVADCAFRLNARVIGVEVTGLHEYVMYPIKNKFAQRNISAEFVELQARGGVDEKGKVERVKTLVPFYRQGKVLHNKSATTKLENQLLSFPRSKLWDVMDAAGYITEMLEKGLRYASPYDSEYAETYEDIEDEYLVLEEEGYDPPIKNFRLI